MTALSGPDRDQLRQQLAEVFRRHDIGAFSGAEIGCTCDRRWRPTAEWREHVASAFLPVLADELDRIADELNTPDQQIEIVLMGADHVYDHLRTRTGALRTHEGDTDGQ